ncbi:MAG: outer membrane lipoprotein carrier protein LolA [Pseudomonadota bacterium]
MKYIAPLFVFFALILTAGSGAQAALSQADNQHIARAQAYLQDLQTVKANFTQINADKEVLKGTFYLWRPGRMRFSYNPPRKDLVVADGLWIHFYDAATREITDATIGQTLADFILRKKISLDNKDLSVKRVRQVDGEIQITVVQASDPGLGSLTLVFKANPYYLLGWRVVDAQGLVTTIRLENLEKDLKLPASLFVFKPPAGARRSNNQ